MILCGGRGTCMLRHIMKSYAHKGFIDFVRFLDYRGSSIKDYFRSCEARNNDVTIGLGHRHEIAWHGEQDCRVALAGLHPGGEARITTNDHRPWTRRRGGWPNERN